jgi:hypothetical protein
MHKQRRKREKYKIDIPMILDGVSRIRYWYLGFVVLRMIHVVGIVVASSVTGTKD